MLCRRVIDETHDVKTFVLTSAAGRMFCFSAGQYVLVHLRINGAAITRAYSVSSPPTRRLDLQITVKRTQGGLTSNWIHDHLTPGSEIEIEGPLGSFNLDKLPSEKPVFLSGGSGVTPTMSMLRALTDCADDREIRFIHSAKTPGDIIFRAELEALAARFPNVQVTLVCGQGGPAWTGSTLAISSSVRFVRSGVEHRCAPGETLLDAARNCGIYIPACQQGVCGTCRIAKLSGEVAMDDLGGLNAEEKSAGYVLACCSRPRGTVLLDA
ncbi:oxidoreductase [Mesorhizobium sp. LSHC414A00]|nr:oxidoreductase [Mesorhizobium sp. LSHC414A00]